MITGKISTIFLVLFFCFDKVSAKEFNSLEAYFSLFPKAKLTDNDGNWLKEDRQRNTEVWNKANKTNIKKSKGDLEYIDIHQRCDFYKWFEHKTDSLGFETRWAGAAKITTSKLT